MDENKNHGFTVFKEIALNSMYKPRKFEFGGGFNINGKSFAIKEVIYSNPATVILWDDNTKTVAKCHPEDEYNPETGLTVCVLKKLIGGVAVKDLMEDWLPDGGNRVSMKDVRRRHGNK